MLSSRKTMATHRLHRHEMKKLVRILHDVPAPSKIYGATDVWQTSVQKDIKELPRRLRSSLISVHTSSNELCKAMHSGLNHHLMNDIWSWLRHEIKSGLGKFLYPIIMSDRLTPAQELQVRQLEPVLEMLCRDFKTETSAPPGREPIRCGSKWRFQADHCAACMLGRIGSDEGVLLALFAGMVGRLNLNKLLHSQIPLSELKVEHLDKVRSKRVRFLRYWIKAATNDDDILLEAGLLGIKLKKMHKELKVDGLNSPSMYGPRHLPNGSTLCHFATSPLGDHAELPAQMYAKYDISHRSSIDKQNRTNTFDDPKLGPTPRPSNLSPHSPVEPLGFTLSDLSCCTSEDTAHSQSLAPDETFDTASTIYPDDSISVAPLRLPVHRKHNVPHDPLPETLHPMTSQAQHSRPQSRKDSLLQPSSTTTCKQAPSCVSSTTILSYNHPSKPTPSPQPRPFDPLATPEETLNKYKALLTSFPRFEDDCRNSLLPKPLRTSMYFGFEDGREADPFEEVDLEGGEDEDVEMEEERGNDRVGDGKRRGSRASTRWGELY